MKRILSSIILVLSSLLLFSGCCTIMSGKYQEVSVSSAPEGAKIFLNDEVIGTTPTDLKLERKIDHRLLIELEGYQTDIVFLSPSMNNWVWGNIIFAGVGGIIFYFVDDATGSAKTLYPKEVSVKLTKNEEATSGQM